MLRTELLMCGSISYEIGDVCFLYACIDSSQEYIRAFVCEYIKALIKTEFKKALKLEFLYLAYIK
jgi:hypothetical protein